MPLYDFLCKSCGEQWEDLVAWKAVSRCPRCKKPGTRQMPQRVQARYRGSGFYSTDYKKSS